MRGDDVERLNAAQQVLLSPLGHADPAEWQLQCNRAVRRLVGADHSLFSLPSTTLPARPALISDDTDPSLPARFLDYFVGTVAGEYRFRDPYLQNAERRRRAAGGGAFHELDLGSRDGIRRSLAVQEIFRPAGMTSMIAQSTARPVAEATQIFGFEGARAEPRSERGLALLQLVVPVFAAGVRLQHQWLARGKAFAATLDRAGQAAAVFSIAGTPLHLTRGLREMLAVESERDKLQGEMHDLARVLGARWSRRRGTVAGHPIDPRKRVRYGSEEYRLIGSYLESELLGAEAVLVLVERQRTRLPSPMELTARFPLSRREAEAALLIARGLTDSAVAERLGVSPHTARRYSERVLKKLALHSRAAVAITILEADDALRIR